MTSHAHTRRHRPLFILILALCVGAASLFAEEQSDNRRLWYRRPAATWSEALPVGNGRLGAMIFGGVAKEHLQLNESSVWSGRPGNTDRAGAFKHLPEVRRLLFEGKPLEAEAIVNREFLGERPLAAYQPLGDLWLDFAGADAATEYHRELDLDRAIVRTRFRVGDTTFVREVFASAPHQLLIVRLTSDRPGRISFSARLDRAAAATSTALGENQLELRGQADAGQPTAGVHFVARLKALSEGGRIHTEGNTLRVEGANTVTLFLAAATDYAANDPSKDCDERLNAAASAPFDELRAKHLADYGELFHRVELTLGESGTSALPTDERLSRLRAGSDDPGLAALFFHYGRYLLIASSRAGGLPANLQGLWNEDIHPAWFSGWHFDINAQMNYWLAETAALSECHAPFFDMIDKLRVNGRKTARDVYDCSGFVVSHRTNAWWFTSPVKGFTVWPTGAAWLCQHVWEHYLFTGDRSFLEQHGYPVMKEAAEFFLDWLVPDPRTGLLVSGPSLSPENAYLLPGDKFASLGMGPAMDQEIIAELFDHCLAAANELGASGPFVDRVAAARRQLAPAQVGSDGRLLEWARELPEREPGHRHMSHLYAVYPGSQITPRRTPALSEAARASLAFRIRGKTTNPPVNISDSSNVGWSLAWNAELWARLGQPAQAHDALSALLRRCALANLMDSHPRKGRENVFQIDGNLGGAAAICEMLLQSHAGEIELLPALPAAWSEGSFSGLRARGGFIVDARWRDGALTDATLRTTRSAPCVLRAAVPLRVLQGTIVVTESRPEAGTHVARFQADAPTQYIITPVR